LSYLVGLSEARVELPFAMKAMDAKLHFHNAGNNCFVSVCPGSLLLSAEQWYGRVWHRLAACLLYDFLHYCLLVR